MNGHEQITGSGLAGSWLSCRLIHSIGLISLATVAGLELTPPLIQFFGTQAMQVCIRLGGAACSLEFDIAKT